MKGKIPDRQRLLHILEAISEIEKYTSEVNLESFLESSMMRFASIKQIEIIGEAANVISEETKKRFSEIEWRQIIGMRHVLVHEYFGVDNRLIWQVIIKDIPQLKSKIEFIVKAIDE